MDLRFFVVQDTIAEKRGSSHAGSAGA